MRAGEPVLNRRGAEPERRGGRAASGAFTPVMASVVAGTVPMMVLEAASRHIADLAVAVVSSGSLQRWSLALGETALTFGREEVVEGWLWNRACISRSTGPRFRCERRRWKAFAATTMTFDAASKGVHRQVVHGRRRPACRRAWLGLSEWGNRLESMNFARGQFK